MRACASARVVRALPCFTAPNIELYKFRAIVAVHNFYRYRRCVGVQVCTRPEHRENFTNFQCFPRMIVQVYGLIVGKGFSILQGNGNPFFARYTNQVSHVRSRCPFFYTVIILVDNEFLSSGNTVRVIVRQLVRTVFIQRVRAFAFCRSVGEKQRHADSRRFYRTRLDTHRRRRRYVKNFTVGIFAFNNVFLWYYKLGCRVCVLQIHHRKRPCAQKRSAAQR